MKYIIYGVNRVAKDFIYVFDNLDILYFVDDIYNQTSFLDYKVHHLDYALKNVEYDKIIICDFDKTSKIKNLNTAGLKYEKDYIYEEDFFDELDSIKIPQGKKVAIWGTGNMAKKFYTYSKNLNIECYIDSNKSINMFFDIPVISPDEIQNWKKYFIIIAVVKDEEIRDKLSRQGLKENEDYVGFQKIIGRPSEMLRKTIFDQSYYELECNTMLNHLEVFYRGNTRCCCTTFVEQNLDNIFDKDVDELWHSNIHKIMCLSTENKTYSFCDKSMCPLFVAQKSKSAICDKEKYKNMTERPEVLALGYDSSCNLCCETCRKELYIAKGDEYKKVKRITDKIKEDYLGSCRFLILAGDGEVFGSQNYKLIYEDPKCNPEYIRLLSNGTLFTPDRWERFITGKTGKIMLTVSIDAATKETYEQIRRNGNFEQLQKNMLFASKLRKEGQLRYFRLNFVVQKRNYKEMIPFVEWGNELGVDEIFFTKILNWGTFTEEEFEEVSMMEKDGITPKKELKEVLENPIIKNSPIVDLGTIQYSHKIDKIDKVNNYYMWELEKRGGHIFDE